jgi:hypothetical protein
VVGLEGARRIPPRDDGFSEAGESAPRRNSGSGEPGRNSVTGGSSGSGEPAAPRRQSLLRSQARCALLPAATPPRTCCRASRASRRKTRQWRTCRWVRAVQTRAHQGGHVRDIRGERARDVRGGHVRGVRMVLRAPLRVAVVLFKSHPRSSSATLMVTTARDARQHVRGGSPREGARSELASAAATGGGGPQAPPTRITYRAPPIRKSYPAPPTWNSYGRRLAPAEN